MLFQIQLKSVLIKENGKIEDIEGVNMMSVALSYPNPQDKNPTTVIAMGLKDDETMEFSTKPLKDRLVFKGMVIGDSSINVSITAIDKPSKFDKLITKIFGAVVTGAIGLITGGAAVALVTAGAKVAAESIFEELEPQEKTTILGQGEYPISRDTPEGDLVVNLSVPKEVKIKKRFFENGQTIERSVTVPKGYVNAMVVFDVKKYPNQQGRIANDILA